MSKFNCPYCGRLLVANVEVRKDDHSSYGVPLTPMRSLADSVRSLGDIAPSPEFSEAYRDTPARAPSKEADVSVPFWKTIITGGLIGIPSGIIAVAGLEWPWWWLLAAPSGTTGLVWLIFMFKGSETLWIRERIINKDIDNDGHVGKPPSLRVEYEDHEDGRDREVWADLPLPGRRGYAGLISFAKGIILQDETFSERAAADYSYTRTEWQALRDVFIHNGWAVWNHPDNERQGVTLLASGKSILRKVAQEGVPRREWIANE